MAKREKHKTTKSRSNPVLSKETISDSSDLESIGENKSKSIAEDQHNSQSEDSEEGEEEIEQTSGEEQELDENSRGDVVTEAAKLDPPTTLVMSSREPSTLFKTDDVRPKVPFLPPFGFVKVPDVSIQSSFSKIFSKSGLDGKELWHITVPSKVSLGELETLSFSGIRKGKSLFEKNGVQYGLSSQDNGDSEGMRIMIPSIRGYVTSESSHLSTR
jgi:hypothetical protein